MRIEKYNGEKVIIAGRADSILSLTMNLIRTLRMVGTASAFSQEGINEFLDEVDQLHKLLRPEKAVPAEAHEPEAASEPTGETV